MGDLISIIIRTKDEERWITQCLRSVFRQNYKNFEVIVVDNESSDKTVEKARQFNIIKILTCRDYLPGKALNMGIREAKGEFIVSLSGHCIPVGGDWLSALYKNFDDSGIAGVYGRQEPMSFTSDADKRDLNLIFGLDRKVQLKDSFFHNANSMIRKRVWDDVPFDEKITNIEDRVWAQQILQKGYRIIYEPEASIYHYHGIHQNGNIERCANVVKIIDTLNTEYNYKSIEVDKLNIVALIPFRGQMPYLNNKPLLFYTMQRALESKYIKKIIVSTDNKEVAALAEKLGAEVPFLRNPELSKEEVGLSQVIKYSLDKIENLEIYPDIIVLLEVTFPFRPKGLLDDMIQLAGGGFDSIIAVKRENRAIWKEREKSIVQIEEGLIPRKFKDPAYLELRGVACVTHPEFIRKGNILGSKIGIYEVNNPYSHLEVRDEEGLRMASLLIGEWFK